MRWKTLQFFRKLEISNKEMYGFKSRKCPQTIDELIAFEDDLMSLIKNIEFRNVSNTFQEQLAKEIKKIKCTNKIIVRADKTRNLYKVEKKDFKKYQRANTTKTYKKSINSKVNYRVDLDAKKVDKLLISE